MTPLLLAASNAALLLFIGYVAELKAPDDRVFVGAQLSDAPGQEYAWTKCVPESHVFVIQLSTRSADLSVEKLRFVAAHEVAHVRLHAALLCDPERIAGLSTARRREMEAEADRCAVTLLTAEEEK